MENYRLNWTLFQAIIVAVASLSLCSVVAAEKEHSGYIYDVESERQLRPVEISIVPEPEKPVNEVNLKDLIFDQKLTTEFESKYEEKFGLTQAEIQLHPENKYIVTHLPNRTESFTAEELHEENQLFGEYMMKRLTEHHVDAYFKDNPTMKKVYEYKEKVSNLNVEVRKGYKMNLNYDFADNSVKFSVDNPYDLENKIVLKMDPQVIGPSDIQERIFFLKYHFDKKYSLGTNYKAVDGIVSLVGENRVSEALTTNVTGQTFVHDEGESLRDNRVIFGFTYTP